MKFLDRFRRLTEDSQRWKIYLLVGISVYYIAVNTVITLRPDHIFLTLLLLTFALGGAKAKRFLIDWLPFIGFWVLYDMMRGVADSWRDYIYIREVYDLEFVMFGKLFGNDIPAFWFQQFQHAYDAQIWKKFLDVLAANFYSFHFFAPPLLGWILWHTCDDRRMFYRFVWTLTVLNVMALITFFVYPAAPPWYVLRNGFEQPAVDMFGTAGGLVNIDRMINMNFFTNIWDNLNPNHFAAIPSLHGGYPILVSYFAWLKFRKAPVTLILYILSVWCATVYVNHHYFVDVLIAAVYSVIAYIICAKILMPLVFDPLLFKKHDK